MLSRAVDRARRLLCPQPVLCSALDPAAEAQLTELSRSLAAFYNGPARARYFATALTLNAEWPQRFEAHTHLRAAIPNASSIVDLGCGSAHFARHLDDRGGRYIGVDWSADQVADNRRRWPQHQFIASSIYNVPLPDAAADVVVSLYAIEHCVWPHRMLQEMHRLARLGGLIAILTPPFRARSYLKSFDYGLTPRPFMEKVRTASMIDALWHLYHHRIYYPLWLRRRHPSPLAQHRFLIHLNPVVLTADTWFPDADAVYLSDTVEMLQYLKALGSETIAHWPSSAYLLMRKTESGAPERQSTV